MSELTFITQTLNSLKPELASKYFVNTIGLFGSIVRDDYTAESDIDILVDFTQPVGMEFIDLADFIEGKLRKKIDLVSRLGVKPKYLQEIESEIIYV